MNALELIAVAFASGLLCAAFIYWQRREDEWDAFWLELEQRDEAAHRAANPWMISTDEYIVCPDEVQFDAKQHHAIAINYNADGQPLGSVSQYGKPQ